MLSRLTILAASVLLSLLIGFGLADGRGSRQTVAATIAAAGHVGADATTRSDLPSVLTARPAGGIVNQSFAGCDVAVMGAPNSPEWNAEVQAKLVATGSFSTVDVFDISMMTPTLAQMQSYSGILVYTDGVYLGGDRATFGNNLADYVDAGGGVVTAVFATASLPIGGRFDTDNYYAIQPSHQQDGAEGLGMIFVPGHPILAGVTSFSGGGASYRPSTDNLHPSAVRVANWTGPGNIPLIATRDIAGVRRADLGFFPPSSDCSDGLWETSTDGARIMANALLYVCGAVPDLCGNGTLDTGEQCDDGNTANGDCCLLNCQWDAPGTPCTSDDNVCTDDRCDGAGTCDHDPNAAPCDDGDACTTGDVCSSGTCGGGAVDPESCVDHYLCYRAKVTPGTASLPPVAVSLVDQFSSAVAQVVKPKAICLPANKNGGGVLDPDTHEESYQIRAPKLVRTNILVDDQFGSLSVNTLKPDRLLVPTGKQLGSPASPPSSFVDHYQCYRIHVTPGSLAFPRGIQATVVDQFENRVYDVRKPRRLCTPAIKDGSIINNASAHLMCYQLKPAKGQPKHTKVRGQINTLNQFGSGQLDTVKEEELCVPALVTP